MNQFPIIDAHVHFWKLDAIHYPWLAPPFAETGPNGSVEAIAHDYLPRDYRGDAAAWNVVGAVHVEAGADPNRSVEETQWLQSLAASDGLPSAIVAHARLDDPNLDRTLAAHVEHASVRGIRHIVNFHTDPRRSYTPADVTRDERWQGGFGLLERHRLSFDLQCYPAQMTTLARLFDRHPEVSVIVNHLGMPVLTDPDGLGDWRQGMRALAALPQVAIKMSGFGFIERDWREERIISFLEMAVELFGAKRAMVASDAPTDLLFAPFDRSFETLARFISNFTIDEQRDLWGRNADRIYRLGLSL